MTITDDPHLLEWRTWLAARGQPTSTVRLRTYQLLGFARTLDQQDLMAATASDMLAWIGDPELRPNTRRSRLGALRSFYRWAFVFKHVEVDESLLLPPISTPRSVARPAPESAIASGMRTAAPRERLMVRLAAQHGLRRAEVACVHSDDVVEDLVGWSLRVHGKGDKERVVPLDDETAAALRARPAGWAFPSPRGGHLTPDHVGVLIAQALPDHWTAHPLRHRFATTAYAGTRDLLAIQELLGHAKPETTRGYIQLPQDALRAAVSAASVRTLPRVPASDEVEEAA